MPSSVQNQINLYLSCRYLDNVVNKQTVAAPIPHLHALLTSGDEPPPEIDVFELIRSSYEVSDVTGTPMKGRAP